jgi:23S rRNA pseudouridine1911/1915/1917 synthase
VSTEKIEYTVPSENAEQRLDLFLPSVLETELSRSYIQKLVKRGAVTVNGIKVKPNCRLKENDIVGITIPEPEQLDIEPHNIPVDIIYEDEDIAVINKPAGISVHPGAGTRGPTLVSALLFHLDDLSSIGGVERPGIVHRLDKDTSGLMVIAKNDIAHRSMSEKFHDREISKEYAAITWGAPAEDHLIIEKPIGRHPTYRHKMTVRDDGRDAKTELYLTKTWLTAEGTFSLFRVILHTGRTHQIRVHLSSGSMPIVGDPLYSKRNPPWETPWLMLASVKLSFKHPVTGKPLSFSLALPAHFQQFIDKLDSAVQ